MKRRGFLKTAGGVGAVVLLSPALLLEGCPVNVTNLINTVLDSAAALLKVIEPTASYYTTLEAAIAALKTAEATWKAGGTVTIVEDALTAIEAVLAVIPVTAPYAPLVDILVAGIEAIFAAFGTKSAKLTAQNVHLSRTTLKKPHFLQTPEGAYKQQWNDIVNGTPALAAAKL